MQGAGSRPKGDVPVEIDPDPLAAEVDREVERVGGRQVDVHADRGGTGGRMAASDMGGDLAASRDALGFGRAVWIELETS